MIREYLHNVFETLQKQGLIEESAPYFHEDGIIYFWLKNMPEKSIALRACNDSENHLWVYAESIPTEELLNGAVKKSWIRGVSAPLQELTKPATFFPQKGYGPMFMDLYVWHEDVESAVQKIIGDLRCGLDITRSEPKLKVSCKSRIPQSTLRHSAIYPI